MNVGFSADKICENEATDDETGYMSWLQVLLLMTKSGTDPTTKTEFTAVPITGMFFSGTPDWCGIIGGIHRGLV